MLPSDVPLDFKGWVAWNDLFPQGEASAEPQTDLVSAADLVRVGCYLIGHVGRGEHPTTAPNAESDCIVYIGEAHGASTSLRSRLRDFGRSAGLFGDQVRGHYAGWWYPWRFPERRKPSDPRTSADGLCVAIQPCPFDEGDAVGAFPLLIEGKAIWRHVAARGALPLLNNKGRRGAQALEPLPDEVVGTVISGVRWTAEGRHAARWLAQLMAVRLGGKPWDAVAWDAGERVVGAQPGRSRDGFIYIRSADDGAELFADCGGKRWFESGELRTVHDVQGAWETLWRKWWRG
jgi:hypothetical protein